jgi:hypothetical protein
LFGWWCGGGWGVPFPTPFTVCGAPSFFLFPLCLYPQGPAAIPQSTRDHSNRAFSGRVMRFNKGIAANTTSADRANPPSMVM